MRLVKAVKERFWVILIGTGLAISPIHNVWLTNLATNSKGEVVFFLPAFGYLLLIMGVGLFLLYNWEKIKREGFGDKRIWIPLLVIVGAIGLSGIVINGSVQDKVAPLGMGVALFALYLAARVLGKELFYPLVIGTAIGSLGIVLYQAIHPGAVAGGFVFEQNFDIATGYILLGAALFVHRWRWILASLAVVALLVSGAPEAVFALGVVGIFGLVRRDWSKRIVPMVVVLGIFLVVGLATGLLQGAYSYVQDSITRTPTAHYTSPEGEERLVSPLDVRWLVIRDAMTDIRSLGIGYGITNFRPTTVHNVPLIIIQQLGWPGVLAAIAWLWTTIWCLRKTRWKYAWVAVIALSIFDHYLWTQLAPVWWILIGVSITGSTLGKEEESDLVFRRTT
jgi:hypothetical protein